MDLDAAFLDIGAARPELSDEFSSLSLGDSRLDKRLVRCLNLLIKNPGKSIPEQAGGWSETKAFYRLLDQETLTSEGLLEAHSQSALRRALEHPEAIYLAIQDTTTLNFSSRDQLAGRGDLGNGKGSGLLAHSCLLMGADSGRVHGLLGSKLYARDPARATQARAVGARNREAIEQKESGRWLEGFQWSQRAHARLGGAQVVNVADREADIYELLVLAQSHRDQGMGLLVRSNHNRGQCGQEQRIWESLASTPPRGSLTVSAPAARGLKTQPAELTVRFQPVELAVPRDKVKYAKIQETVRAWLIEVTGVVAGKPVLWRLLSTSEVNDIDQARQCVRWYCARWQIEVFHRILKTGCRVEQRQLRTMDRLRPMIALDMVVAVHLLAIISSSRASPQAPASSCFDHQQLQAICWSMSTSAATPDTLTLDCAVRQIARLGGFLARKNDGCPGPEVLWRGLQKIYAVIQISMKR